MLYYDRIEIGEGIDPTEINKSKECMIWHYWLFNHEFKFQDSACNGCHDLTILCINISDIAIITVKNFDYRCVIHNISKSEAINLFIIVFLNILIFSLLKAVFFLLFWFSIYKMVDSEYSKDNYKSSKISISIRTVMKKMLKFFPDHLKTKKCVDMQLKNYLL